MIGIFYGVASYVVFLATFLYAIGFIGNFLVPKSIDVGVQSGMAPSLAVNAMLLGLFAVQHSVMARPGFKRWWTRIVPPPVERSTFVLLASLVLCLLFWQWRPLPQPIWSTSGAAHLALAVGYAVGWLIVLLSTFMLSHFELFGLAQVWRALARRTAPSPTLQRTGLYRLVRHPIMLGFLIAFWSAPVMTVGRLVFAAACTGYIFLGIQFEERDLTAALGEPYQQYRREVGMLLPSPRRRSERT
jgi:methanethiol S-methyltransferase